MLQPRIISIVFNHIVFPPSLPGSGANESETEQVQNDLRSRLAVAVEALEKSLGNGSNNMWLFIKESLKICAAINGSGVVNKTVLLAALRNMQLGNALIVYIGQQNACLLIRKPYDDDAAVIFEAFETSPAAEKVLATEGALQWDFPGMAVSLPACEFEKDSFQEQLADFIEKASLEPIDEFATKTRKAGVEVAEIRDAVEPAIITQFLMTLLEINGSRTNQPKLRKRVKDDVLWDNAEIPWRREPFWLVLRVCVQRLLYLQLGAVVGRIKYKFLMCIVMAQLLEDCTHHLSPEQCDFLKRKLCRRLAKLSHENSNSSGEARRIYENLSAAIEPLCQKSIDAAETAVQLEWLSFKRGSLRRIPTLPSEALDRDLRLSLPNSSTYLQEIPTPKIGIDPNERIESLNSIDPSSEKSSTEQFETLSTHYSSLAEIESGIESDVFESPESRNRCESLLSKLADRIKYYMSMVGNSYENDPVQMSLFILSIFQLWMHMDKCATTACPLLLDYHPWLMPELLDVLLLSRLTDMERLHRIQVYLRDRCARAATTKMTIFTDPQPSCFAEQYFNNDPTGKMHDLRREIQAASSNSRRKKEAELGQINAKFQHLTEQIASSSCTNRLHPDGSHDIRGCGHCYYLRCRRRLKIGVHEDFLPHDGKTVQQGAVLFELGIPNGLALYRDVTWHIIATLCLKTKTPSSKKSEVLLGNYSQLAKYNSRQSYGGLTLASYTKSYLNTHYKWKRLPADVKHILLPFGLTFSYYDAKRKIWLKDFPGPLNLVHHLEMRLPQLSPFSRLYSSPNFAANEPGPSSYEVIASTSECPPELNVHEFLTHQNLIGGKNRRWFSVLIELGSSNVNFSSLETTVLFRFLALQAGPQLEKDPLRAVHVVFRDGNFCNTLAEKIDMHVDIISNNWREHNYMETLLDLAIRLCTLCPPETYPQALELLQKIRHVTITWVTVLRNEMRNSQELDITERAARYCFLSALLCRQTFSLEAYSHKEFDTRSLKCFTEATLAMQEALVVDMSKFTIETRNMLIRSIKMATAIRPTLKDFVAKNGNGLELAIDTVWPTATGAPRIYSGWEFLPHPCEWWVTSIVQDSSDTMSQIIHLHLLEGHLLVDGHAMGKLPADIRDSEILKELFGNQRLVAFPSNMPCMSYSLAVYREGHQIHLGYRNQQLIIWALKSGRILELVPRHVFGTNPHLDLPNQLVHQCVHWIDLHSRVIEIRRHPRIWKDSNWVIDVRHRRAYRGKTFLVDMNSKLFKSVAQIFHKFEEPHMLTVLQPFRRSLYVELKRMALTFHVNRKGLLQCRQLSAEIDPDQDAGTLYGLMSMLVLRDVSNRMQRSIITPIGNGFYQRRGMHVHVYFENTGDYARYNIDTILGRLHSPQEPRLLYHKAQLHALTSCFIPDPLTSRTGTEEALSCLQSGNCQPWAPLTSDSLRILTVISHLTPQRGYYPKDMRCQQTVNWNSHLTTTIQHDAYQSVVERIIQKSEKLALFHDVECPDSEPFQTVPHLRERSLWRRSIYECPGTICPEPVRPSDIQYVSRDNWSTSKRASNVREIVHLLKEQPQYVETTRSLMAMAEKWPLIGGYVRKSTSYLIKDYLVANLAHEWGSLIILCRECKQKDAYNLMFQIGLIAFGKNVDITALKVIASFFILDGLNRLEYPSHTSFSDFKADEEPTHDTILDLLLPFREPRQNKQISRKKKRENTLDVASRTHLKTDDDEKASVRECERLSILLLRQWPCANPIVDGLSSTYINITAAMKAVNSEWLRLYKNQELSEHIRQIQTILDRHYAAAYAIHKPSSVSSSEIFVAQSTSQYFPPRLDRELVQKPSSRCHVFYDIETAQRWIEDKKAMPQQQLSKHGVSISEEIRELEAMVKKFTVSQCPVRSRYGCDLEESIVALKIAGAKIQKQSHYMFDFVSAVQWFNKEIKKSRSIIQLHYSRIISSFSYGDPTFRWLSQGNLWPRMTPVTLLEKLRSNVQSRFGEDTKASLIEFGQEISKLQRLIRIKGALGKRDEAILHQECNNKGHANWDPFMYPDWLLLEIDANIQVREEQVTVALEMISPASGSNTVLQMNMGQGKTSIIMPMVASVVANGRNLARLLVPKALLSQTAQTLQARLGGLVGREVTHVPFSRRTPTTLVHIRKFKTLYEEIHHKSGIILGIPEHVLSFKLSGLQRMLDSKLIEAVEMVDTQRWIDSICHDVLDECDFTLAVKTQLIYPSGSQLMVDGHPDRWEVSMATLSLAAHHIRCVHREFRGSIDIIERASAEFPIVYFSRKDVEGSLVQKIAANICENQTHLLPMQSCSPGEKEAIRIFISQEAVPEDITDLVSALFPNKPQIRKNIYLLRGLLAYGILVLCLKKRWNVQYGLHPHRDPIAVPFHAKGVPSDQAEWGHPDVAILLTCLSFYYQGLSQCQFRQSLQVVLTSDDPATEYDRWTQQSASLPESLRHWNIINLDDQTQLHELWHYLHLTVAVINYYLRKLVFPIHAKQFDKKLQTSGWDIPQYHFHSNDRSTKHLRITTGFSGTNDNRRLLPLTIQQRDLPNLLHTNAEVLTYLLQTRNRRYILAEDQYGRRISERGLLTCLKENNIRVLIDAGAFILEMDNRTLARTWLQENENFQAAVYFGPDNKAWVQYQTGKNVPLLASPFADNMENCLVYLDEAHTRGTDLKLPPKAVGALTLGLNQTKDHTVQAAMRLRQLGTTQSITFIAPPEVHQSIVDARERHETKPIDSSDVILWLLSQTCSNNRDLQSLYYAQGTDFCHRMQAEVSHKGFLTGDNHRNAYLSQLQRLEKRDLVQLYAPQLLKDHSMVLSSNSESQIMTGKLYEFMQELKSNKNQVNVVYGSTRSSAFEEVEQEREVSYEVEEERQLQRPRPMKALYFPGLHNSIVKFVHSGIFDAAGAYVKASKMLESTKLGLEHNLGISFLMSHLNVSSEFTRTVHLKQGEENDSFIRPVNWILVSPSTGNALIIIPEEAEAVIPIIRTIEYPLVHLILYAAPFTKRMMHFNNLNYFSFPRLPAEWIAPSWLPLEVGLLAGRLYFDYSEYIHSLGDFHFHPRSATNIDRTIVRNHTHEPGRTEIDKLLGFLQDWLPLRRSGQDISQTPMGFLCHGLPLYSDHPFFSARQVRSNKDSHHNQGASTHYRSNSDDEEYYDSEEEIDAGMVDGHEDDESTSEIDE